MKRKIKFSVYPLAVLIFCLLIIFGCSDDVKEPRFALNLEVNPGEAGDVAGAGAYEEGTLVEITATAVEGWGFVKWTGNTDYVDDLLSANTMVAIPGYNITLAANFREETVYPIYGDGVTDIDGNNYITVIIGNQEWMAENLRAAKYNNGSDIPTGLSNTDWQNSTTGAYAIYAHGSIDGLGSDAEVVSAYGKLYNWHTVDDSRGLCPEGWSVPSDEDWTALVNYVSSNEFGFSALPGGSRSNSGFFEGVGVSGQWWSSSEYSKATVWIRNISKGTGNVARYGGNEKGGISVRCFREVIN